MFDSSVVKTYNNTIIRITKDVGMIPQFVKDFSFDTTFTETNLQDSINTLSLEKQNLVAKMSGDVEPTLWRRMVALYKSKLLKSKLLT